MAGGPTNPTEQYFKDGQWGWDGTQWRKLALSWGYSDRYAESLTGVSVGPGATYVYGTTVPAGEVWVVEAVAVKHNDPVARNVQIHAVAPGVGMVVAETLGAITWGITYFVGRMTFKAGDRVRVQGWNVAVGQTVYLEAWGYKMRIG